jgi:hypothetical protein
MDESEPCNIYIWYKDKSLNEDDFIDELGQSLRIQKYLNLIPEDLGPKDLFPKDIRINAIADSVWYIMKLITDMVLTDDLVNNYKETLFFDMHKFYEEISDKEINAEIINIINPLIKYQPDIQIIKNKKVFYIPFFTKFFPIIATKGRSLKYYIYLSFKLRYFDLKKYIKCFDDTLKAKKDISVEHDLEKLKDFNLKRLEKNRIMFQEHELRILSQLHDIALRKKQKEYQNNGFISYLSTPLQKVLWYKEMETDFEKVKHFIGVSDSEKTAIIWFLMVPHKILPKLSEQDIENSKIIEFYTETPNYIKNELVFIYCLDKKSERVKSLRNLMGNIMDLLAKRNEKEKTNFLYKLKFESKIIELTYDESKDFSINCGLFMQNNSYRDLEKINSVNEIFEEEDLLKLLVEYNKIG